VGVATLSHLAVAARFAPTSRGESEHPLASKKDNSKVGKSAVGKSAAGKSARAIAQKDDPKQGRATAGAAKPAAKPVSKASAKPAAKVGSKSAAKPAPAAKGAAKGAAKASPSTSKASNANGKSAAVKASTPAAKANGSTAKANGFAAKASTPAAKSSTPAAKSSTPAAKSSTPAAKSSTTAVKASTPSAKASRPATKGAGKPKPDPLDPPTVPKKGPIDLAQHKSVAAAAAAVANARGAESMGEFIMINGRRVRAISTKGLTIAKRSKDTTTEAPAAPTDQQIASIKTKLAKKELEEYRTLLVAKRRQLAGMLSGMEDQALRQSGGNLSNMPVHMADMGSDVYEQDFTLGMAETERAILEEIDTALQRIEDKTFGVCQMTGKPITKARLDAKPWAKYTIEAERISESNGGR
jgi:DnaK suppressor protein